MKSSAGAALAPRPSRRNVLLLYCEQFQHDVASFAGGPARTPNLLRLAAQSTFFRTACTTTGLCSPARSALFTGRFGHRTGLDDNCHVWHSRLSALSAKQTTLIEWARAQGYLTAYFGKWHLGPDGPIRRGADRYPANGFERHRNPAKTLRPNFEAPKRFYDKSREFTEKPGFYSTAEGGYDRSQAAQLARAGVDFLAEASTTAKPFFLTLSFNAVHPPYHVPEPYNHMYDWRSVTLPRSLRDDFRSKPAYQRDIMWPYHDTGHMNDDDWRRAISYYRGFVTMLDRAIGEVLDAVRANGLWDDTMIVVVADHGDMCGAHNRFDKGPYCYDEIQRIPLLLRVPGAGAREVQRHVSSIDVNRTVVEWAGLKPGVPCVDSRSLLPLVEHGEAGWAGPDQAFYSYEWYNGLWFGIRAIRTPQFKYCFNPAGPDELYDLLKDPEEMNNLVAHPGIRPARQDLTRRLLQHLENTADSVPASKLKAMIGSEGTGTC